MKSISASTHLKPFSRIAAFYLAIALISSLFVSGIISLFFLDYYQSTLVMLTNYYLYALLFIAPLFLLIALSLAVIITIKQSRQFFNLELSRGINKEQLFPVFQPIVDSRTGEITGAELLARWKHPELGFVELEQFIPLMEKNKQLNGLVSDFFDKAAEMLPNQSKLNYLSINITPSQIRDTSQFISLIRILNQHSKIASKIMLELTERATDFGYDKRFIKRLNQLKSMGFHIALDDFGTGQNGLELLRSFRPDVIKIDKSYVDLIGKDHEKLSILEAIIDIATKMDITIIAEGVENIEQNNYLSKLGVFNIQGFHYFRPLLEDVFISQLSPAENYDGMLLT